ncbi:MAG: hypothetical protein M1827_006768 [Pycnora praestabilis]|nr:MAG: hypothetical protein M1827_006768 [Pycnora praestabilis]
MPKKYHNVKFNKPASSTHPSLLPSTSTSSTPSSSKGSVSPSSTSQSVNELFSKLRQEQRHHADDKAKEITAIANVKTVHPSLNEFLDVAVTPAPRPRPGLTLRARRGPAGPPPPTSWLTSSMQTLPRATESDIERISCQLTNSMRPSNLHALPGMEGLEPGSLMEQTLKTLAANWKWHVTCDQYYLATLPTSLKSLLLSHIAVYGRDGVGFKGLKTLFLTANELPGSTGNVDVTHLDLSGALDRSISLKQLNQYFTAPITAADSLDDLWRISDSMDFWEDEACISLPISTARFPNLTHLSLSHPGISVNADHSATWPQLLAFAQHMTTLTHLSLAYWPTPSLKPIVQATSTVNDNSPSFNYGGSTAFDKYEAGSILKRLSKATYCLKWLDLTGCRWVAALKHGVDWNGGWRQIEKIIISQGWRRMPSTLKEPPPRGKTTITTLDQFLSGATEPAISDIRCIYGQSYSDIGLRRRLGEEEAKRSIELADIKAWLKHEMILIDMKEFVLRERYKGRLSGISTRLEFDVGWTSDMWWIKQVIESLEYGAQVSIVIAKTVLANPTQVLTIPDTYEFNGSDHYRPFTWQRSLNPHYHEAAINLSRELLGPQGTTREV